MTLPRRVGFLRLYAVRLIGEAVNNITPTAYLGGEPVKASLLRRDGVPMTESLASVTIAKTTLTIAQAVFMLTGVVLFTRATDLTDATLWLIVGPFFILILCWLAVGWQKKGVFASLVRLADVFHLKSRWLEAKRHRFREVDSVIHQFMSQHSLRFWSSVGLHFIGWALGAVEVYVIFALLGHPLSWIEAYMIESLSQLTKIMGFFVPGSLGIHEAGGVVIFRWLGYSESLGLTLILLKRVREAVYTALGFLLLALERRPQVSNV